MRRPEASGWACRAPSRLTLVAGAAGARAATGAVEGAEGAAEGAAGPVAAGPGAGSGLEQAANSRPKGSEMAARQTRMAPKCHGARAGRNKTGASRQSAAR